MIKDNNNWDYRSCFTCQQSYYEMGVGYMCPLHGTPRNAMTGNKNDAL